MQANHGFHGVGRCAYGRLNEGLRTSNQWLSRASGNCSHYEPAEDQSVALSHRVVDTSGPAILAGTSFGLRNAILSMQWIEVRNRVWARRGYARYGALFGRVPLLPLLWFLYLAAAARRA
ncbi:hypothetical protein THIX_60301 [Thiomonas sp. X19]|nr:hypothetical protein THIX_60301 [Thiomonas sp. X19]